MDDSKQKYDGEQDEEKDFPDTLFTDQTIAYNQDSSPKVHDTGINSSVGKSVSEQPKWIGKKMGHFKLLRLIGRGSMGLVIQAEDINLKRIVALKILRKELLTNENEKKAIEQFLREARAAASIEHPNIVRVFEINQHAGLWYIAMEMVAGNSLKQIIKAAGALPVSRACPIIADVAVGLQVAHSMGIIHRDIKPSNILVTRNGHGKVSDFGLVRVDDPNDPLDIFANKSIGTPLYASPEIIRHETISPAIDIYSLGATLFHTLTGRPPYTAKKIKDILDQHLNAEPPNLKQFLPDCSINLSSLISRMMAKTPESRPTAAEVAAILNTESIPISSDLSGTIDVDGSTLGMPGIAKIIRTQLQEPVREKFPVSLLNRFKLLTVKYKIFWSILSALFILIVFSLIFFLNTIRKQPKQDREAINKLFPNAPSNYGVENPESIISSQPVFNEIPSFSWKNKIDASNYRFVASKTGHYFYPIEDKRAILIRADQFIGYQTIEQAQKDRKELAPKE